jgi:hypothetical protein
MGKFVLNNKLSGKAHFQLGECPLFDLVPDAAIIPMPAILEDGIGTETALFLIDKTPYIYTLAKVKPFDLMLKTGMVATSHGPVAFLIFYVPNADDPGHFFFVHDCHLDPFNPSMMASWRDLARQSHWHLILVDGKKEVVGVLEFENVYDLGTALTAMSEACAELQPGDFQLAKREFCEQNSLPDLFQA